MNRRVKILDCTLRDGGYYNDWDFDIDAAEKTIAALSAAGVDIIEVGYKTRNVEGFCGLFKYCNEDYLEFLEHYPSAEYAFMLDVKEFCTGDGVDLDVLDSIVRQRSESVFSWCRLALTAENAAAAAPLVRYLKGKGYNVTINLMGISLLPDAEKVSTLHTLGEAAPDALYFADSFGSMYPDDIKSTINSIRTVYDGPLGIHTHDNQGLAFANSITAFEQGVDFIDSTITGMGRGAGNLHTEQFLLWLSEKIPEGNYNASALLGVIHDYYSELKSSFRWGYNYLYMLSGLKNIHPSYCMAISDGTRFTLTMSQISDVLERIDDKHRVKFDKARLDESINELLSVSDAQGSRKLPVFDVTSHEIDSEACLVVAPGKHVGKYGTAIEGFLTRKRLMALECNYTGVLDSYDKRIVTILNRIRLNEARSYDWFNRVPLVTGQVDIEGGVDLTNIHHLDYEIGALRLESNRIGIPDYDAGEYAICLAILMGYRVLYLAGFEGYDEPERNRPLESFFNELAGERPSVELTAITPTNYRSLKRRSIYSL